MTDAEFDEKRRVAREALLAVARLTPAEMRYFESAEAHPGEVRRRLIDSLQQLIGGQPLNEYHGISREEKLKYVPFKAWAQWEQAQQRFELLKDVYPELQISFGIYRGVIDSKKQLFIWWSEEILKINYIQQVGTPDDSEDVS